MWNIPSANRRVCLLRTCNEDDSFWKLPKFDEWDLLAHGPKCIVGIVCWPLQSHRRHFFTKYHEGKRTILDPAFWAFVCIPCISDCLYGIPNLAERGHFFYILARDYRLYYVHIYIPQISRKKDMAQNYAFISVTSPAIFLRTVRDARVILKRFPSWIRDADYLG